MPPRLKINQDALAQLLSVELFKKQMLSVQENFQISMMQFEEYVRSQQPDPKAKKIAFIKQLIPVIADLRKGIATLNTPEMAEAIGVAEAKRVCIAYHNKIFLALTEGEEYAQARAELEKIKPEDRGLPTLVNLALGEENLGNNLTANQTRKFLLQESSKAVNKNQAQAYLRQLKSTAGTLLRHVLTNPSDGMDSRFLFDYPHLLDLEDITYAINHCRKEPKLQASWRGFLFTYLKANPVMGAEATSLDVYYHQEAEYLLLRDEVKCFDFVSKNFSRFPHDELAKYAFNLMLNDNPLPEEARATIKQWLIGAAESTSTAAMWYYFVFILKNRQVIDLTKLLAILPIAFKCADVETKRDAHFIHGLLYDGELDPMIAKNKVLAFQSYKMAANLNSAPACTNLAAMYANGEGTPVDEHQALAYYEKAHLLKDCEAATNWAKTYLSSKKFQSADENVAEGLAKALRLLNESKSIVNQAQKVGFSDHKEHFAHLLGQIAYVKARCLWAMDQLLHKQHRTASVKNIASFRINPGIRNPECLEALLYAVTEGNDETKASAASYLGQCYLHGMYVERDKEQALTYFKQAVSLAEAVGDSLQFEAVLSEECANILNDLSSVQPNALARRALQVEALAYAGRALSLLGEQCSQEVLDCANLLMKDLYKPRPNILKHEPAVKAPLAYDPTLAIRSRNQLQEKLNDPLLEPSAHMLHEVSTLVVAANHHVLKEPKLLARLAEFVGACVENADIWNLNEINSVFQAVGRWHLAAATEALKPLLMRILKKASFSDYVGLLKSISQCNFSADIQKEIILPFIQVIGIRDFLPALSVGQFSIADAARLFHILALFDANQPNETYVTLAKILFKTLKTQLDEARIVDVSQIYHAYHYFKLQYPDPDKLEWCLGKTLREYFSWYQPTLLTKRAGKISKTQAKIYGLLQTLDDSAQQEFFIPEAGRQVDFVVRHFIIQYNGDRDHEMSDNQGGFAYHSLKENLSYKTLALAARLRGQEVVRILRGEWAAVNHDDCRGLDFLRQRFPELLEAAPAKTPAEGEVKLGIFCHRVKPECKMAPSSITFGAEG